MRILVVTQYFWPETFRINELCQMFVERGHAVTILTGVPNYPSGEVFPEYRRSRNAFAQFGGANVVRVPMFRRGTRRMQLALNYASFAISAASLGSWRLRGQRFDVIFVYEPSPITVGIPAMVLRRLKGIPSCLWILDLWPETPHALGMLPHPMLYRATQWGVRCIYRRTDLLLVQSPGFVEPVGALAPSGTPIEYFPSWADAVFESTTEPEPAAEVPAVPGSFNVLFAGNVGEAQDFGMILDAAEALATRTDIRFLVVGDGRQLAWVRSEVERRHLSGTVLMLGRHPVERMPAFFAHADALLVSLRPDPVFSKTIPAKVQAYMASGKPIVAALDGEGADAVRRWKCGLVVAPGDSAGLVAAVVKLADGPVSERVAMGENGRAGADSEFNRHVLVDRLLSWLEELTQGSAERRLARKVAA